MYLNFSDDVKLSMKLIQTIFLILIYIHITACFWFGIIRWEENWEPGIIQDFLNQDFGLKFFVSIYTSILALCGNDIYPASLFQFFVSLCLLITGAIL